jgi:hypothetical protein
MCGTRTCIPDSNPGGNAKRDTTEVSVSRFYLEGGSVKVKGSVMRSKQARSRHISLRLGRHELECLEMMPMSTLSNRLRFAIRYAAAVWQTKFPTTPSSHQEENCGALKT